MHIPCPKQQSASPMILQVSKSTQIQIIWHTKPEALTEKKWSSCYTTNSIYISNQFCPIQWITVVQLSLYVALALYQYSGLNSYIHKFHTLVRDVNIQFTSYQHNKSCNHYKNQVCEYRVRRNEILFFSGWVCRKTNSPPLKGQVESTFKIERTDWTESQLMCLWVLNWGSEENLVLDYEGPWSPFGIFSQSYEQ